MQIYQHRKGLPRVREALKNGKLTVGYIGGSITDGRGGYNWPEPVTRWFTEKFPDVRVHYENAAIGATGSELAVFRAQADLIDRGCDLVFIEFAVNDNGDPQAKRARTREGLIRKLLAGKGRDLILAYTYGQDFYESMMKGDQPQSIKDFEVLGEHYGIGSVWMSLYALEEVKKGRLRWEEWLPDGLHPQHRGSLSYGQSVIAYLEKELITAPSAGEIPVGDAMPAPRDPRNWEHAYSLPFSQVKTTGPWTVRRWLTHIWIDNVLDTSAVGAKLEFEFEGRGLSLGFDFGKTAAEFKYRLDRGEWTPSKRDRPAWCGPEGWYRMTNISEDLPLGKHHMEIEVTHGNQPDCTGTNFKLGVIGVIK
jgi:lysophospholipase L1-like esterase